MSQQTSDKPNYKKTLNLPKTAFAMKANLVQREPQFQKRWAKLDLYRRMRDADHPRGRFVLHDGPPYANGPIHLGHLLNKVLKDMVVRSRSMMGCDTPFIPGWDCHGLPIEHRVMKELGEAVRDMSVAEIRKRCAKDAGVFIKLQSKQMQRLGTVGDYDQPYITMARDYEAAVLEVFANLVGKGLAYRQLKPVHWSIENRTALADAELEYEDREDTSVFVLFEIENTDALAALFGNRIPAPVALMIWTTTPWTLPANLAVAAAPQAQYGLYHVELGEGRQTCVLMADELADKVLAERANVISPLGTVTGRQLADAGLRYRHPFCARTGPIVTADYVTLEDGTGLVHTAPGHGVEDYQTGLNNRLHFNAESNVACVSTHDQQKWADTVPDIYCPVLEDGTFDDTAPHWLQGRIVWEANERVVDHLRDSGHLFHHEHFTHSYPHDWRSKTPVIFRATEQWFISVDREFDALCNGGPEGRASMRRRALEVTAEDVQFYPEWGRNRMRGVLESRPDWCISRQRAWGLPIPAFMGPQRGQVLLTVASVNAVADQVRQHGSDVWFKAEPHELLAEYDTAKDTGLNEDERQWVTAALADGQLQKGSDIFDVWFESGSSWNAVVRQRLGDDAYPVDLYLEGSDQHRGWFQLSLLPSLGCHGVSPFNAVLTHGFMVDKFGRKMSKSLGNTIDVEDLLRDYGADVCRWWVASLNVDNDIKADPEFFRLAGEEYRKVRNTIRFLLSNLSDFDPAKHHRPLTKKDATSIDAWAMSELARLINIIADPEQSAYANYAYKQVQQRIHHFCNETMSSVYLAAVKDRLYCDAADADRRRRTQTVLHRIADAVIRLVAPILVHTADEAWLALHGCEMDHDDSVHLQPLPEPIEAHVHHGWAEAMALRDRVLKVLEDARAQQGLDNPLDAGVSVMLPPEQYAKLAPLAGDLADLCGVSRFELVENGNETLDIADLTGEPRCERSWKRDGTVKQRSDGGWLSDRDAEAIGVK